MNLDYQALTAFSKRPVNTHMVEFLASVTASVIRTPKTSRPILPLTDFITGLVEGSNVQTPTLMSTAVYLRKLKAILPANVQGMETTTHRIFLGCLILASKNLNDRSPMNKHWCNYTSGMLNLVEVNKIERELLTYLDWNVNITINDLMTTLAQFLNPIKESTVLFLPRHPQPLSPTTLSYWKNKSQTYAGSECTRSYRMSLSSVVSSQTTPVMKDTSTSHGGSTTPLSDTDTVLSDPEKHRSRFSSYHEKPGFIGKCKDFARPLIMSSRIRRTVPGHTINTRDLSNNSSRWHA